MVTFPSAAVAALKCRPLRFADPEQIAAHDALEKAAICADLIYRSWQFEGAPRPVKIGQVEGDLPRAKCREFARLFFELTFDEWPMNTLLCSELTKAWAERIYAAGIEDGKIIR